MGSTMSEIDKEQSKKKTIVIVSIISSIIYLALSLYLFHILHLVEMRVHHGRATLFQLLEEGFQAMIHSPLNCFPLPELTIVLYLIVTALLLCVLGTVLCSRALRKHDNPDTVQGSARLMTHRDLVEYNKQRTDPIGSKKNDGPNNMILSRDIFLALDGWKTRRNCSVLVIGGSGAGKTRFFAAPNILNYNTNFVITDPSGEMLQDYGKALEDNGYTVRVFNLVNVYQGNRYNPFHYIKEEKDIFILVNTFIKNTTPPESKKGDQFWEKCEMLLLQAVMLYLWHVADEEHQTFGEVVRLINMADVDENENAATKMPSKLDSLFDSLEKDDPDNLAVSQYKTFKQAAGKTMKSILISVGARMQPFQLSNIRYLTSKDEFEFETFADSKQALFVVIPTADTTFNFLASMMYSQLFMTLYNYVETRAEFGYEAYLDQQNVLRVEQAVTKQDSAAAKQRVLDYIEDVNKGTEILYNEQRKVYELFTTDKHRLVAWRGEERKLIDLQARLSSLKVRQCGRRCTNHVRLILDEFANIGQIPDFNEKLATIRKYEISCTIILQAISQLKKMYKDDWNTIIANCDSKVFLGNDDTETIKWLVEILGKKTVTIENMSMQEAGKGSSSYNKSSRELLSIDQISMLDDNECIVRIRGVHPYKGIKYDVVKHPNYAYARSVRGQFNIDAKKTLENIPFRLRKNSSGAEGAATDAESSAAAPVPETSEQKKETDKPTPSNDKRERYAQNAARKATAAENKAALKKMDSFPEQMDEDIVQKTLDLTGLSADSTDEQIKEAVESVLLLPEIPECAPTYQETE